MGEEPPSGAALWLLTPASWCDLDLTPATRTASVAALLDARMGGGPERAEERIELGKLLEGTALDAFGHGALFASVFSDVLDGRPVAASVVVNLVHPSDPTDGEHDGDLAARLQGGLGGEVVALPAGSAVRRHRRQRAQGPDGTTTAQVETVEYFVPAPEHDRVAVLSFSTPNVDAIEAFGAVFDSIAGTLQWKT